jgi:hypothetical protein
MKKAIKVSKLGLYVSLFAVLLTQSPAAQAQNFNGSQPGTMVGPSSGWAPTSPQNGSTMATPMAGYAGWGGYRYTGTGGYLNPYGQPVTFNPLVPYVWRGAAPLAIGGAAFNCRIGNVNCSYWRAASGYYYPYLNGMSTNFFPPILYATTTGNTEAKLPAPAIQLSDMTKFLDDSLKDKKLAEAHYKHLKQRTLDLQRKEKSLRLAQGGELDSESEAEIRRDMEGLTKEMTQRVTL